MPAPPAMDPRESSLGGPRRSPVQRLLRTALRRRTDQPPHHANSDLGVDLIHNPSALLQRHDPSRRRSTGGMNTSTTGWPSGAAPDAARHQQAKKKAHGNLRWNLPEWVAGSGGQHGSKGRLKSFGSGSSRLNFAQDPSRVLSSDGNKRPLEFGPFRADGRRKSLTRNGELVPLPAKAFDVLYALLQKPGQTVLKDELMKEVWPDTFVEEGNLTQMVFLLRKALGETDGGQPLIVTVPRQGYRFVGDLTDPATEDVPSSASTDQPASAPIIAGPRRLSPEATAGILAVKPGLKNIWWIGAAIAIVSGFSGWVIARYRVREPPTEPLLVRYTIAPPENTSYRAGRVSPDGRSLALIGVDTARQRAALGTPARCSCGPTLGYCGILAVLVPRQPVYRVCPRWQAEKDRGVRRGAANHLRCRTRHWRLMESRRNDHLQRWRCDLPGSGQRRRGPTSHETGCFRSERPSHTLSAFPAGRTTLSLHRSRREKGERRHLCGVAGFARCSHPPARRHFQRRIRAGIAARLWLPVIRQG